jgi:hypothetical protein
MRQADSIGAAAPKSKWRRLKWLVQGLVVLALLYYPIGALTINTIDDDLKFAPRGNQVMAGGSAAVAMAAALVTREIHSHAWVANDPFFLPGAILDDMPHYQQGILSAVASFAYELKDQTGRLKSGLPDPDLQAAAGLLQYSGTRWRWDLTTSLWPISTSEEEYARAADLLFAYNARVAKGDAVFGRQADNLLTMLDRMALDLNSAAAAINLHIKKSSNDWVDNEADDLFYGVKGQAYGDALILKGLRSDYARIILEKDLGPSWDRLDDSLKSLTALKPALVTNGRPDSLLAPNHLGVEGFYLLKAESEIRNIALRLQK